MGRKSSSSGQDRREGAMDKAKGRMKEAVGSLSGNKAQKREALRPEEGQGQRGEGQTEEPLQVSEALTTKPDWGLTAPALLMP
jgi:uncharacterized protein YjbJ (UPF0337 family)